MTAFQMCMIADGMFLVIMLSDIASSLRDLARTEKSKLDVVVLDNNI